MVDVKYAGLNLSDEELKAIESCEYDIADLNKFLAYLKINKQAEKVRYYKTSKDTQVDLLLPINSIMSTIIDFEEAEQKKILAKQKIFRRLHTTAINTRRMSVGGYAQNSTKLKDTILSGKKTEILEFFGRMFSVKEVFVILKQNSDIKNLTEKVLVDFYKNNLDEIKRLQEKHKQDYSHLRLAAKTSRLEELTYLYGKLKRKYEVTGNREDHKALLATMESIRKEVEGDKLTVNGNIGIQVQNEVNLHVKAELMKGVPLKEVILSRLAARSGINPLKILNSLNDSYYAKWNRLINNTIDIDHEEISFPSLQNYDFDEIKRINEDKQKQDVIDLEKENSKKLLIQQNNDSEKDFIKQALLQKLKQSSTNITNKQTDLDRRFI